MQPLPDQRNPPPALSNGSSRSQQRMANDPRHRSSLPVPGGPAAHLQNGHGRNMSNVPPLDMARSPPNNTSSKNTRHVPCKFFRQGACQAGAACPFLHSTDAAVDSAPCKYFTKGNCKFGQKCALAHILPNGHRVNRPNMGMGMGPSHLNLGGRVNPPPYHTQDSNLSLLSQQRMNGNARYSYPYPGHEDVMPGPPQPPAPYDNIPIIDAGLVSDSGSRYGSPADETRLPMSPIGRTALDAPLPASFDSQGISYMARHGPVAASLPSKFGMEAPTSQPRGQASEALRNLHDTAFGSDLRRLQNLGSSPPVSQDEGLGPRLMPPMHSQRLPRTKMLSASVPRQSTMDEWDRAFSMEEDYLPTNLHDDVLTAEERRRRSSRSEQEMISTSSRELGGLGMMSTSAHKVGSPLGSSPSRFGALFAKQRQKKEEESQAALGHVGSPLRDSSLNSRASPSLRPIGSRPNSGDVSPFYASPTTRPSMSMISEQLNNTSLHPNSARHTPTAGISSRLDRTVSSPMSTGRIDEEEQGDLVFSMEEEENNKRNSTIWDSSKAPADESTA